MMRFGIIVLAGSLLILLHCKHESAGSALEGIQAPDAEGLGMTFVSALPAVVAHEAIQNLPLIAAVSNPDKTVAGIRELPVVIRCQSAGNQESRCELSYTGPEVKLNLTEFFFHTMAGTAFARRGCTQPGCVQEPLRIHWRSRSFATAEGKNRYEIDVCRIDGLEAGITLGGGFTFLTKRLNDLSYKPKINGFRATIEEMQAPGPLFDDYGFALLDSAGKQKVGPTTDYRIVEAYAGAGPVGPFPTDDCLLSGGSFATPAVVVGASSLAAGKLPDKALATAPGKLVKFLADVTDHLAAAAKGADMAISLRCRDTSPGPICAITYRGPEITIPLPSYITGVCSANVVVQRECRNLLCRRLDSAEVKLATFIRGGAELLEVCSMKGMELTSMKKLPWQDRILGAPDLAGAMVTVDTSGGAPILSKFRVGIGGFGDYPTSHCELGP